MANETTRTALTAASVYGIPEEVISAAIEAGHLRREADAAVTIGAKASPTGKEEGQPYDKLVALTIEGMAILMNGKIEPATPTPAEGKDERTAEQKAKGVADHFNYGIDLDVRQSIRGKLATELEGPSKTIEKTAKQLVEAGLHSTLEEAREAVIAGRRAKGLAV